MAEEIPMIAATKILKPLPARIGKVGDFTLPRTLPLAKTLIVGGVSLVVFLSTVGFLSFTLAAALSVLAGFITVGLYSVRIYKGETLLQAVEVKLAARLKKTNATKYAGEPAVMYIGIAKLPRTAAGSVRIKASSVAVDSNLYDERGVLKDIDFLS